MEYGDVLPSDVLLLVESKAAKRIPSDPAFGFLGQPENCSTSCRSTRKRVCSFGNCNR